MVNLKHLYEAAKDDYPLVANEIIKIINDEDYHKKIIYSKRIRVKLYTYIMSCVDLSGVQHQDDWICFYRELKNNNR